MSWKILENPGKLRSSWKTGAFAMENWGFCHGKLGLLSWKTGTFGMENWDFCKKSWNTVRRGKRLWKSLGILSQQNVYHIFGIPDFPLCHGCGKFPNRDRDYIYSYSSPWAHCTKLYMYYTCYSYTCIMSFPFWSSHRFIRSFVDELCSHFLQKHCKNTAIMEKYCHHGKILPSWKNTAIMENVKFIMEKSWNLFIKFA